MNYQNNNKNDLFVNSVFDAVYQKYDLVNNIASFGLHNLWKKNLISWLSPKKNKKLIDVASGTGDIAEIFLKKTRYQSKVVCIDTNKNMINISKDRLKKSNNVNWIIANAEKMPLKSNIFDYYIISFGLRNVDNKFLALKEAYRVLKPGGRFMCLEFSKLENKNLNNLYKKYSRLIPEFGKILVGKSEPYNYLIKSIDSFMTQEALLEMMKKTKFENLSYRNLSGGIVAIHSGWKI